MLVNRVVVLAVHGAVNRVDQAVSLAAARMLEERGGENAFAAGRKRYIDRIIHAARHHGFNSSPVRTSAKDVRSASRKRLLAGPLICLLGECPFAPVNPGVGTEIRSMKIVGAPGTRLPIKPFDALIGGSRAFRVGQFPDDRRRADVE